MEEVYFNILSTYETFWGVGAFMLNFFYAGKYKLLATWWIEVQILYNDRNILTTNLAWYIFETMKTAIFFSNSQIYGSYTCASGLLL